MKRTLTAPIRVLTFALWFGWQIVHSSGAVLLDVLSPGAAATPRVVRMPLDSRTDFHVAAIGALITMTPGTLTLGVAQGPDGWRTLLVHSMYHKDATAALDDLADMETRMLHALTIGGSP